MIEYKEGKQVVTHPSGHIDIYDIDYIERFKLLTVERNNLLLTMASEIDMQLDLMSTSIAINPV
jgi:hypothetical protein